VDRQLLYSLGAILALGVLYLSLRYLLPMVLPFVFGAFVALMLEPVVDHVHIKGRLPRPFATGITIIGAVAITVLLMILLSASVAVDVRQLINHLPAYSRTMIEMIQRWVARSVILYGHLPTPLLHAAEQWVLRFYNLADNALGKLLGSLGILPYLIMNLVISFIAAYFISKDRDKLVEFVGRLLPAQSEQHLRTLMQEVLTSLVGLVWAQLILVTITTLVALFGLWLLKVPYPMFIGLLSGVLDIIPVSNYNTPLQRSLKSISPVLYFGRTMASFPLLTSILIAFCCWSSSSAQVPDSRANFWLSCIGSPSKICTLSKLYKVISPFSSK
jgi:predicted PurR-regulated permease PerM